METIEELSKRAVDIQKAANEIIDRYSCLSSLIDAAVWKSDALALQNLLDTFQSDLSHYKNVENALLQVEEDELKKLSFLKKMTADQKSIKKHKENINVAQDGINSINTAKSTLVEIIDDTPTNKEELKRKIFDLTSQKRELTVEKRSVNEEMRQVRTVARQQRANISGIRGGTLGKVASYQRTAITYGKEKTLSPLESQKGEIEYQLIDIEKKLNRYRNFMADVEITIEPHVLRCAYCGRRVNPGEYCPGCGSDVTTVELG